MSTPEPHAANHPDAGAVSPYRSGLACSCPRCGKGALFAGLFSLDVRPACTTCGQSYAFADSGDGPAVFAIFILGFLVLGLALYVQFKFDPPLWLLLGIAAPVTLGLAIGLLKPLKATLIALQFKNKAAPGRLADRH
jgi:uncharacterized protein (DUF983 family)